MAQRLDQVVILSRLEALEIAELLRRVVSRGHLEEEALIGHIQKLEKARYAA